MPLRKARPADLVPVSKLLAREFRQGGLLNPVTHPYIEQHPDELYLDYLRALRLSYLSGPDQHNIVSYKTDADGNEECITGYARWWRRRANPPQPSLYTKALLQAVSMYNYLESLIWPDRTKDPKHANLMQELHPFVKHFWMGTRAESWDLGLIAVDSKFQKRGIGQELVKYGLELAKKDGVVCSVVSAYGKEPFYRACGFHEVGTVTEFGGERNPLSDSPGGLVFFWDNGIEPEGIETYRGG